MQKQEEFKKLMDEIIEAFIQDESISMNGSVAHLSIITKNVLEMLINLSKQIEDQGKYIERLETQLKRKENEFKILVKELTSAGFINLRERRKLLKRESLTQEALINILKKEGLVNRKKLLDEIRKLRDKEIKTA